MFTTTEPMELTDADFAETKPQAKPVLTVAALKQQALEREAQRAAQQQSEADQHAASLEQLRAKLQTESPLGAYPFEFSTWAHDRTGVTFFIPRHADITAVFDYNRYDGEWTQRRLSADGYGREMYRVWYFDQIDWDHEDDKAYAKKAKRDFEELGDALLFAERAYRDPDDIQREVSERNAQRATHPTAPAPEPTPAEILLDALRNFVHAELNAREFA